MSADAVDLWSRTIDVWSGEAHDALSADRPFRLSSETEPEVVEYLLDGLHRCIESPAVMGLVTPSEVKAHQAVTVQIVRAFLDGLQAECDSCQQYAEQILTSLSGILDQD